MWRISAISLKRSALPIVKVAAVNHSLLSLVKMNMLVLNIVVVLSMFVVESPASLDCNLLPKVRVPDIKTFSTFSPYEIVATLSPVFECSTEVFTYPARGDTSYNGTALSVKGSTVITFDYVIGSDEKSLHVTTCNDGLKSVWYLSFTQFDWLSGSGHFCVYSCNGTALAQFDCRSNNKIASDLQSIAIIRAKTVSNGDLIQDGNTNCTAHNGCKVF